MRFVLFLIYVLCCCQVVAKTLSISIDDVTRSDGFYFSGKERTDKIISALKESSVEEVLFYAIGSTLKKKENLERLKKYKNAGHLIGNHTYNHEAFSKVTIEEFLEGIKRTDIVLEENGLLSRYFRFPYLDRGDSELKVNRVHEYLKKNNYIDGYTTIVTKDWLMDSLFQKDLALNNSIQFKNLKRFYIDNIIQDIEHYYSFSKSVFKREIKHVLLLHENDLTALFLKDLISELRKKGWDIGRSSDSYNSTNFLEVGKTIAHNDGRVCAVKSTQRDFQECIRNPNDLNNTRTMYEKYSILEGNRKKFSVKYLLYKIRSLFKKTYE